LNFSVFADDKIDDETPWTLELLGETFDIKIGILIEGYAGMELGCGHDTDTPQQVVREREVIPRGRTMHNAICTFFPDVGNELSLTGFDSQDQYLVLL